MKKGLSHIDWAISMGIFLIYILSLFIFIKPSFDQDIKQEDLLPILLKGFDQDTKYIIDKTPLYIDYTGNIKTIARISFTESNKFPFSGDDEDFALVDTNNNYIPFIANLNNGIGSIKFQHDYGFRTNNKYIFWLLYSQNMDYSSFTSAPEDKSIPEEEIAKNDKDFTYKFGITETIKGISSNKLNNLQDYETLKQNWKFPDTEEFSLAVYSSPTFQYDENSKIFSRNTDIIAQQTNVFTREFKDHILKPNTGLNPVIASFKFGRFLTENE